MPDAPPPNLRALVDVAMSLVRRTASGTVVLARYEPLVDYEALPQELREPAREELARARAAAVEPLDARTVSKATKGLADVSAEPLAVTPTAQVHRAELDGEAVAVKVARPGLANTVRAELSLLDLLVAPLRMVFGRLDVGAALNEVREGAMDELDLEHEGETSHQVGRALRRSGLDVVIPKVHLDECGPELLVTELLEGTSLADAVPADAAAMARTLIAVHLTAWREAGLVLTDCRPSHVLDLGGGKVGLLGTGLARTVPRERLDAGQAAFVALGDADPARFVAAAAQLDVVEEGVLEEAHGLLREILGPFVQGPARLDGAALAEAAERGFDRLRDLLRLGGAARPAPADLAALRMLGQLVATLARLGVEEDWIALAERV